MEAAVQGLLCVSQEDVLRGKAPQPLGLTATFLLLVVSEYHTSA